MEWSDGGKVRRYAWRVSVDVRFCAIRAGSREERELKYIRLLDEFLTRVEAINLKLKLDKAEHAVETVEALGMR